MVTHQTVMEVGLDEMFEFCLEGKKKTNKNIYFFTHNSSAKL